MLFGALTLTVSTVVTSCKDYDDDIKGLQEQVDKITSTSPVSTEDMKSAVEKAKQDLQTQLNDLSALVENPDGEKTLKEKIAALEQALADATGDKAKDLAARLADLQNQGCIYGRLPRQPNSQPPEKRTMAQTCRLSVRPEY